ncbi:MAG: hypothetical protein Q8R36_04410 [bacterium]|nr:hypothetical protein [bacterium]
MMSPDLFGGGAILLGVLIAAGTALRWPVWTNYVWAAVALLWGIFPFVL